MVLVQRFGLDSEWTSLSIMSTQKLRSFEFSGIFILKGLWPNERTPMALAHVKCTKFEDIPMTGVASNLFCFVVSYRGSLNFVIS